MSRGDASAAVVRQTASVLLSGVETCEVLRAEVCVRRMCSRVGRVGGQCRWA